MAFWQKRGTRSDDRYCGGRRRATHGLWIVRQTVYRLVTSTLPGLPGPPRHWAGRVKGEVTGTGPIQPNAAAAARCAKAAHAPQGPCPPSTPDAPGPTWTPAHLSCPPDDLKLSPSVFTGHLRCRLKTVGLLRARPGLGLLLCSERQDAGAWFRLLPRRLLQSVRRAAGATRGRPRWPARSKPRIGSRWYGVFLAMLS
jgi:hypothetical protein